MTYAYLYLFLIIAIVFIIFVFFARLRRRRNKRVDAQQHYPESEQLYVGNLSYQMNTHQLKELFSEYGNVQHVRLIKNTKTGRSKGFAFVTYAQMKDAKKALVLNGRDVRGRAIVVRMAKPREE